MTASARRVPARYYTLLIDVLRRSAADVEQILRLARIEPGRFEARDGKLLPLEVEALIAAARQLTGRSDLGFEMGSMIQQNSHDLLGYGMLSCRNLDEVMRLVSRHYHLLNEMYQLRYRRLGRAAGEVAYVPAINLPQEMLHFTLEMLAVAHANQMRLYLGDALPTYDVYLSMPEPPHLMRYRALAPARWHFDAHALPGIRVVMGADMLDRPLPLANARVVDDVDERCAALGQRPPPGDEGWGDYVTMMLRRTQGELLTLEDLAKHVHVSARTIDRHLKKEALQFRDLAQQVRFERACALLSSPATTVAQVAADLGFSDAANFSRAFRRVVGVAPGEYQNRGGQLRTNRKPAGR